MKKKRLMFSEIAYLLGLMLLALGTAFMEKADFGMSMVVAPAYLVYRKLSLVLPWFTFGMGEYLLQAILIAVTAVVLKKWKNMYLFSFCTAVIYGVLLDFCMSLMAFLPGDSLLIRGLLFLGGMGLCASGVALLFHTYIAPEAYELLVKEVSAAFGKNIGAVKTVYDLTSCAIAIVLSFAFFGFGQFVGVKLGTVFTALCNGWLIGKISEILEKHCDFRDAWKLRKYFE